MSNSDALQALAAIIKDVRVGMLTTADDQGSLHSRPMETATKCLDGPAWFDGALWFFSARTSAKSHAIERQPRVNVSYADRDRQRYVSISGTAALVADAAKAAELWEPAAAPWFPQGPADPNLGLIRVQIESAEYWDADARKMVYVVIQK